VGCGCASLSSFKFPIIILLLSYLTIEFPRGFGRRWYGVGREKLEEGENVTTGFHGQKFVFLAPVTGRREIDGGNAEKHK